VDEVPTLNLKARDGTRLAVEARAGLSVMENIHNREIAETVAQRFALMPARHRGYSISQRRKHRNRR